MEKLELIRWLITILSVIGAWYNASMNLPGLRMSFRIWIGTNLAWVCLFIYMGLWPEAALFTVNFITAARGYINTRARKVRFYRV